MAFSNLADETRPALAVVRPAVADDLPAIMAIERAPGFAAFVGRSEQAEHRAMLAAPGFAYRLGLGADGSPLAFAILSGIGDRHGGVYLKRVAVLRPGAGIGTAFLTALIDEALGPFSGWRFHLDVFADNARAQRAYEKLGLSRDGLLRQAYLLPDGSRKDLALMAILKPEWEARRGRAESARPGGAPGIKPRLGESGS